MEAAGSLADRLFWFRRYTARTGTSLHCAEEAATLEPSLPFRRREVKSQYFVGADQSSRFTSAAEKSYTLAEVELSEIKKPCDAKADYFNI